MVKRKKMAHSVPVKKVPDREKEKKRKKEKRDRHFVTKSDKTLLQNLADAL